MRALSTLVAILCALAALVLPATGAGGPDRVAPLPETHHRVKPARPAPVRPRPFTPPAILPEHRVVAYYGNPYDARMGVLGQGTPAAMLRALRTQAQAYQALDPSHPVVEALELVATVAQGSPGPHQLYRLRMPFSVIRSELALARSAHALLILDVQVGHSTVRREVNHLLPFLKLPDVELALDPEFDMPPGDVPGQEFGTMRTRDINWAIRKLHDLVYRYHLPQKILIVHQFLASMVPNWKGITPMPGVAFVKDMDGFGGQALKIHNYHLFVTREPVQYGGIKLFYTQDTPLLTPAQVLALRPSPLVVIYQ